MLILNCRYLRHFSDALLSSRLANESSVASGNHSVHNYVKNTFEDNSTMCATMVPNGLEINSDCHRNCTESDTMNNAVLK